MSRAWTYLQRLSELPHRGSVGPGEAAAALRLKEWLAAMGYLVAEQRFLAPRDTLYLGPSAVIAGVTAGLLVGRAWPVTGLLVAALCLIPLIGEMLGSSRIDLDCLLRRHPARNLVARRPARGPAHLTLVVSAHYDTQRASWLFHPRFAPYLQGFFYLVYGGISAMVLAVVLQVLLRPAPTWAAWLGTAGMALSLINAAFLLVCRATGGYINGANDNGSGTALVMALAERYAHSPLPAVDLIFVLTAAEEVGTRGMKAFMREHRFDRGSTRFINIDNVGGGTLHYLTGEGMLTVKPYGPTLLELAGAMAAEQRGKLRPRGNLLLPTDGLIPSLAGYEALTFIAFGPDGSLPNYHWYTDTIDHIDIGLLDFTEELLAKFIERQPMPSAST